MPVWLDWRRLDAGEIAVLLAAPLFIRIVFTPLIGFAADLAGSRRNIVIALAWGSLLSFILLWAASGFWQMLAASILLAINWTTIMPLIETVATRGIRTRNAPLRSRTAVGLAQLHRRKSRVGNYHRPHRSQDRAAAPRCRHGASRSWRASSAARTRCAEEGSHATPRRQTRGRVPARSRAGLSLVSSRYEPDPGEPRPLLQLRHAALARRGHC